MQTKNPFSIALLTSIVVSLVACFVFFLLLRADIIDTRSSTEQLLEDQDSFLQKSLDNNLSAMQDAITANIAEAMHVVVDVVATKNLSLSVTQSPVSDTVSHIKTTMGGGKGIVVAENGYIVTSKHVVQDTQASYMVIVENGDMYPVERVWLDPNIDLAVIKIKDTDGTFAESVQVANIALLDDTIALGQFVFSLGNIPTQLSLGIVQAKNTTFNVKDRIYAGLLQTDARTAPGSSGGPLINIHGHVIGINTAIDTTNQSVSFTLPITQEFIDRTLESILDYQRIIRPFAGIVYTDITPSVIKDMDISIVDYGIYIQDIVAGSPADDAGLLAGDIIVSIDDRPIDIDKPFLYQLYTYGMHDTIRLHVLRNGDSQFIEMTLRPNT